MVFHFVWWHQSFVDMPSIREKSIVVRSHEDVLSMLDWNNLPIVKYSRVPFLVCYVSYLLIFGWFNLAITHVWGSRKLKMKKREGNVGKAVVLSEECTYLGNIKKSMDIRQWKLFKMRREYILLEYHVSCSCIIVCLSFCIILSIDIEIWSWNMSCILLLPIGVIYYRVECKMLKGMERYCCCGTWIRTILREMLR